MTEDVHITISDVRVLFCLWGVKKGFEENGLDFSKFIKEGAMASELYGHGVDAIVDRVIQHKEDRKNGR